MTERAARSRGVQILAKSIARELEAQGFGAAHVVALATQLLDEAMQRLATANARARVDAALRLAVEHEAVTGELEL